MEVDEVFHLACPASPIHYQRNPVRTIRTAVAGHAQHARPGARGARAHPDRVDVRDLRRSRRAPAARDVLGQRQPDRPARLLRRGQALRRGAGRVVRDASTASRCASRASSTPTARACTRTTAASSRTSSCRRCATSPSPSTARGSRRARSATSSDLIEGFVRLMASEHGVEPVNLGNPREITVLELAEMAAQPGQVAAPRSSARRCPRTIRRGASPTSRARRSCSTGGRRAWALEEGLAATIADFKRLGL